MEQVEPDLLPENLEKLQSLYPGETPEARTLRYARYAAAFLLLDAYVRNLEIRAKTQKKRAGRKTAAAQAKVQQKTETQELHNLEHQIDAAL